MYLPEMFSQDRVEVMHELIHMHSFAVLVTFGADGFNANHLPLLIDPEPRPFGTLIGHVARANPVWRESGDKAGALAVFCGPHSYVTPSWYASKRDSGKVVPTWNYAVVHAYGPLIAHHDPEWLRNVVTRLTDKNEAARAQPWKVTDAPGEFVDSRLKAIVGIEIALRRLEGKWKVSQNRTPRDRAGVVAGLRALGDPDSAAMAQLVADVRSDAAG